MIDRVNHTGRAVYVLILSVLLAACTSVPTGLEPVSGFEPERYLGKWYEIARLDHRFERHLNNVSAEYTRQDDGTIKVINRGFDPRSSEWRQIEGTARFLGEESVASLKVSFFGPFGGGYHVIALDRADYRYAMVTGPSRSYLWILARERTLDRALLNELIAKAQAWGFETANLIYVEHDR